MAKRAKTLSKNTTLQVSPAAHVAFKSACEKHPIHLPMTTALNALLQWFAAQPRHVQTAIIANVDQGMEAAYASALEKLAGELRTRGRKSLAIEYPTYELNVAAGPWVDVAGVEDVGNPADQKFGKFTLRISGHSMEPDWQDGSTIEFRIADLNELSRNDDVYIQKHDGTATFKRVTAIGQNQLRLAAVNRQVFPDELHVRRDEIAQIAVARS